MWVGDIDAVALVVDGDRGRLVELAIARTLRSPRGENHAVRVELDDPRPSLVDYVNEIVGCNPDIARPVKAEGRTAPLRDESRGPAARAPW